MHRRQPGPLPPNQLSMTGVLWVANTPCHEVLAPNAFEPTRCRQRQPVLKLAPLGRNGPTRHQLVRGLSKIVVSHGTVPWSTKTRRMTSFAFAAPLSFAR